MKIEKKVLTEALRVLDKVVLQTAPEAVRRQVRFLGCGDTVTAVATDESEVIALRLETEAEGNVDFAVEYKALPEMVQAAKGALALQGDKVAWPEVSVTPPGEPAAEAAPEQLYNIMNRLLAGAKPTERAKRSHLRCRKQSRMVKSLILHRWCLYLEIKKSIMI